MLEKNYGNVVEVRSEGESIINLQKRDEDALVEAAVNEELSSQYQAMMMSDVKSSGN